MTFAELTQLVSSGGVLALAAFVMFELRLIRPVLQAILLHLAAQASPEEREKARRLTPPVGTRAATQPGDSS